MLKPDRLGTLGLLALFSLGLALKAAFGWNGAPAPAGPANEAAIVAALERADTFELGQIVLTEDGNYAARVFRRRECEGLVALLPLRSNAEGAYLMNVVAPGEKVRSAFSYRGRIHDSFPAFERRWDELLDRLFGRNGDGTVYLLAELGGCGLLEKAGWK